MNINLTTKERLLLEDQKSHEETCIQKYTNYANQATDQQLKDIFNNLAKNEQEHYNTINQLLSGQLPSMGQGSGQQQSVQQAQQQAASGIKMQSGLSGNQNLDKNLCTDMLMTEKYVSGTYDTAIFEFSNPQIRDVLNHIQKEEQKHGETIFQYMQSKGMYSPQ